MSEPNVAARLKLFMIVLFVGGFALLLSAVPLSIFQLWSVAVPILVGGGTLLFVGILLSIFFHNWIDESIKKSSK